MMDRETFPTRKATLAVIAEMKGWTARPERIEGYDGRKVWVICCNGTLYLRNDGYVR